MRRARSHLSFLLLMLAGCSRCGSAGETAGGEAAPPTATTAATPSALRNRPPTSIPAPPDVGAPPSDATKTASGLAYKILKPGTGKVHPTRTDTVTVNQTGWTKNGVMFDSSVARGAPITFRVDRVIKGWTEALPLMVEGESRRVWVPAALAYGERPTNDPGSDTPWGDLVFDLELLAVQPEAGRR